MYASNNGSCLLGCLGVAGSILGIIAAIVTITAYFYPDSDELADAVTELRATDAGPVLEFIEDVRLDVIEFSEPRGYVPVVLAVILVAATLGYGSLAGEEWDVFGSIGKAILAGLSVFLVVLPCSLCWIWLYADMTTETVIGLLLAIQLLGAIGMAWLE